ncbi:sensor histidine kinase [Nitrincola iocasae]|uniref:histidine kinase n=1 Tax=Nitrincola iocasae TaxID=2614693 RepID=A0A5J6LBY8_9GAMM|nr:ATP-binding protein [Nitrincola iocasae]QEW06095.1 HAMP domain-containing protein [Nitrincola iocasae]
MPGQWKHSVRGKLLALILLPILLTFAALIGLTAYWTTTYSDRQLYMKVASDLAVARSTLQMMQDRQLERLEQLSHTLQLHPYLINNDRLALNQIIDDLRQKQQFDFLRLLTPEQLQQDLDSQPSIAQLKEKILAGNSLKGLSLIDADELLTLSPTLAEKVKVPVLDTPHAKPSDKTLETRGMFVRTLQPIFDNTGQLRYVLDGGVLLNHNLQFVDTIRDLVYGQDALPEGGLGTVTLFLDDVRVTTNVPAQHQQQPGQQEFDRAIGTRISAEVYKRVVDEERVWLDRAFVVNDWFISAYEPIYSLNDNLIGVLYAGFSESPFIYMYRRNLAELGITLGLIMLLSGYFVWHSAYRLLSPIKRIHRSVMAVRRGNTHARIGTLKAENEFADLAQQFDSMLDELDARQDTIRQSAERLEQKVEQRTLSLQQKTQELEQHIELLKATRAELFTKEKLAVLGELTAGIAHEINNPAAVILGHMDLLQAELGEGCLVQSEIDTVIEQVYRIRAIINNLLQYSRPGQVIDQMQTLDVNAVVQDTLALVHYALNKKGIRVRKDYTSVCSVEGNRQQVQQVLVNLLLNAANAMPCQGNIWLSTHPWQAEDGARGVEISVRDEGSGMTDEVQARIFEPFFTTRENGNGLGLSISRSLARRYGGDIRVSSAPGKGSQFSVYLREKAQLNQEDEETMRQLLSGFGVA